MLVMENTQEKTFLAQVLESMNWTIDKLARESGMSYSQTWDIVTNGIKDGTRLGNIEKIAEVLGIPVMDVLQRHKRQE